VYGRVALLGDAAHPTTPHGARGANMSILDGWALGRLLGELGTGQLDLVLREYEQERVAATQQQVGTGCTEQETSVCTHYYLCHSGTCA
jgi:2-polyprenyl-6-methoxyphenol hydroxylase-like FAD-dependent oxidoreductase